jgi:hypothetical protein
MIAIIKSFVPKVSALLFSASVFFSFSCSDHSEGILYDKSTAQDTLSLRIYLSSPRDTAYGNYPQADTIFPGDSLYLHARINPSSHYVGSYYWMVQGERFEDLSIRTNWSTIGKHHPYFVIVDNHGDTLRDSLEVIVQQSPQIYELELPHDYTSITQNSGIYFRWSVIDYGMPLEYTLEVYEYDWLNQDSIVVLDSTLDNTQDFLWLTPLTIHEEYLWRLTTQNQWGYSDTSVWNHFYFNPPASHSRVRGRSYFQPATEAEYAEDSLRVLLYNEHFQDTLITTPGAWEFSYIPSGSYTLRLESYSSTAAWVSDSVSLELEDAALYYSDTLCLRDTTPPAFVLDSINNEEHYYWRFAIDDQASGLNDSTLQILIQGQNWTQLSNSDSLYTLELPFTLDAGQYDLEVRVEDRAGNVLDTAWTLFVEEDDE